MIRLLLVDYGEVISTPLPEDTITDLAALADQPRAIFRDRYFPGHGGTLQRDRHRGRLAAVQGEGEVIGCVVVAAHSPDVAGGTGRHAAHSAGATQPRG
jgi:hypothetical protein